MASRIQELLDQILNAVYGWEVRDAIHDSIEECYNNVSTAKTLADDATSAANTAAANANSKATLADQKATAANAAAANADAKAKLADTAAASANAAAEKANASASKADTATSNANAATKSANDATAAAKTATEAANTATSNADKATQAANTAAASANAAANSVQEAVDAATEAKSECDTSAANADAKAAAAEKATQAADAATKAANTATANANEQAEAASTAAANANEKAELADTAAANANAKAAAANTATTNANAATKSANDAADKANAAATRVDTAINSAEDATDAANAAATRANLSASDADAATARANQEAVRAGDEADNAAAMASQASEAAASATTRANEARQAAADAIAAKEAAYDAIDQVNDVINHAGDVITDCVGATENANQAAENANQAKAIVDTAVESLNNMSVSSEVIDETDSMDVQISDQDGHKNLHFKLKRGPKGDSLIIRGEAFATLEDLQEQVDSPQEGDMYNVGTEPPYHVYRWNSVTWEDQGTIGINVDPLSDYEIEQAVQQVGSEIPGKYLSKAGLSTFYKKHVKDPLDLKMDKVDGKGLSTNDFTDAYRDKVDRLGESIETLAKDGAVWVGLEDSNGQAILDSSNNPIEGRSVIREQVSDNPFTDEYKKEVDDLSNRAWRTDVALETLARTGTLWPELLDSEGRVITDSTGSPIYGQVIVAPEPQGNVFTDEYKQKVDTLVNQMAQLTAIFESFIRTNTLWNGIEDSNGNALMDSLDDKFVGRIVYAQL